MKLVLCCHAGTCSWLYAAPCARLASSAPTTAAMTSGGAPRAFSSAYLPAGPGRTSTSGCMVLWRLWRLPCVLGGEGAMRLAAAVG